MNNLVDEWLCVTARFSPGRSVVRTAVSSGAHSHIQPGDSLSYLAAEVAYSDVAAFEHI